MSFKSSNVIFKNGHFYDINTKKRVIIKDGAELLMAGNPLEFSEIDPNNQAHDNILNSIEQEKKIVELSKGRQYWKLLKSGSYLNFDITVNQKKHEGQKRIETIFKVLLREDLYVFYKPQKGLLIRDELAPCACEVISNPKGNIEYFEIIYAKSLNSAYWKTYVHYFGVNGASTCNVFKKFYQLDKFGKVKVKDIKHSSELPL